MTEQELRLKLGMHGFEKVLIGQRAGFHQLLIGTQDGLEAERVWGILHAIGLHPHGMGVLYASELASHAWFDLSLPLSDISGGLRPELHYR